MTVGELIEKLQKLDSKLQVVTNLHSDFTGVESVDLKIMVDHGSWYSFPYGSKDKLLAKEVIYVG